MERLLNIQEIADILSIKVATIYGWVSEGFIPHVKLGRLVRFDKKEVLEWVSNHRVRGRKTRLPEKDLLYEYSN